jgi:hypothetical protein
MPQPNPKCPVCGCAHVLKTSPRTDEPLLADCVKALCAELEKLRGATPSAEGTAGALGSLNDRLTTVESLLGQKVCFSTFDEKVAELAGAHTSLEKRVAAIDGKGSATLPENTTSTPADPPVSPV